MGKAETFNNIKSNPFSPDRAISAPRVVDEKPGWQHECQICTGCLHYFPQKAIQWGEYTLDRERYNHPYIKVKELINQKQVSLK
ncbi:MAG: hypothetical protein ACXAEX_12510 [Promethearchaeota archaeon]|jgi:hypothetical protein